MRRWTSNILLIASVLLLPLACNNDTPGTTGADAGTGTAGTTETGTTAETGTAEAGA